MRWTSGLKGEVKVGLVGEASYGIVEGRGLAGEREVPGGGGSL